MRKSAKENHEVKVRVPPDEEETVIGWVHWDEDIPEGWELVRQRVCHHHKYGRMVRKL